MNRISGNLKKLIVDKNNFYLLLILIVVCLCYLNSFQVPFLWDDETMIVGNPLIRGFSNIKNVFFSGVFRFVARGGDFYRPFQILSYTIDYLLWGLNPWGFHVTSLLVHLGSTLLLYWLVFQMFKQRTSACFAALLWGVHPINIDAVTYLSGRGDLLSVFFVLASVNLYLQGRFKNFWYHLPAFLLYVIALLSKENALPLPLILLAFEFLLIQEKKDTSTFVSLGAMGLAMIIYVVTRVSFLSDVTILAVSTIANATILERIMTLPWIFFTSIRYLVIPWPSHMEYHFLVSSFTDYRLYLPFVLVLLPIPLLRSSKYKKHMVFGILCLLFGLGPVSQVFLPLMATFREHWVIIPSLGLFLLLAYALQELHAIHSKTGIIVVLMLAAFWGGLTFERNNDWANPIRLYTHDLQYESNNFLFYNNIAVEYLKQGNLEESEKYFQGAIELAPGKRHPVVFSNLGVIHHRLGDLTRAKEFYIKALEIYPDKIAFRNLAMILISENNFKDASWYVEKALISYPGDPDFLKLNSSIKKSQN